MIYNNSSKLSCPLKALKLGPLLFFATLPDALLLDLKLVADCFQNPTRNFYNAMISEAFNLYSNCLYCFEIVGNYFAVLLTNI